MTDNFELLTTCAKPLSCMACVLAVELIEQKPGVIDYNGLNRIDTLLTF